MSSILKFYDLSQIIRRNIDKIQIETFGEHFLQSDRVAVFVVAPQPEYPDIVVDKEDAVECAEHGGRNPIDGQRKDTGQVKDKYGCGSQKDCIDLSVAERRNPAGITEAVAVVLPPEKHLTGSIGRIKNRQGGKPPFCRYIVRQFWRQHENQRQCPDQSRHYRKEQSDTPRRIVIFIGPVEICLVRAHPPGKPCCIAVAQSVRERCDARNNQQAGSHEDMVQFGGHLSFCLEVGQKDIRTTPEHKLYSGEIARLNAISTDFFGGG